jgi:CRP-like cAMP-binding protein
MGIVDQSFIQQNIHIGSGHGHGGIPPMQVRQTLEKVELFRSLDAQERLSFERRCNWRHVQAKQWLLEYNDVGTEVYFLTSGAVRVVTMPSSNCDVILDDIQAGNHFGEMAAIDALPRSAAILAMTDSTIACMSAAVFREFLYRYPAVSQQLLKQFVTRIRALDQRVNEFSSMHVKNRIYAELLRRARPDSTNSRQGIVSPPPIHADIAGRVSTRREMVARELKILEREGLLVKRRGAFVLTNVPKLVDKIHQDTNDEVQTRCDSFRRPVRIEAAERLAV